MNASMEQQIKELEVLFYNFLDLILSYAVPVLIAGFFIVLGIIAIQLINNIVSPINKDK